jgi:hypothetical protein
MMGNEKHNLFLVRSSQEKIIGYGKRFQILVLITPMANIDDACIGVFN